MAPDGKARVDRDRYFMGIAMAVRARANCRGNHVGAILVLDGHVVSTGYNGTPSDMVNPGATQFTLMPFLPSTWASCLVKRSIAYFDMA